jgi:hypothetical protein
LKAIAGPGAVLRLSDRTISNGTYLLFDPRLVLVPTLVTLGVTVLRLAGELLGWPSPWFDKTNGLVGITWILPPIFGFYFAWKIGLISGARVTGALIDRSAETIEKNRCPGPKPLPPRKDSASSARMRPSL